MRLPLAFVCALSPVLAASLGCSVENPDHVQDTTGAETGWDCVSGSCNAVRTSFSAPVPDCEGADTELLVGAGALAILCAVSRDAEGADVVHVETCRPLACGGALDCPQYGARSYACIQSICQVEDETGFGLDPIDVSALCLFDVPRHASCDAARADALVSERLAAAQSACEGAACTRIPAGCLEP